MCIVNIFVFVLVLVLVIGASVTGPLLFITEVGLGKIDWIFLCA